MKRVIILSDLHVGSSVSVMPESFVLEDGQLVKPSEYQQKIKRYWHKFWEIAKKDAEEFVIIINGECIDGNHHDTTQILSPSPTIQVKNAIKLLEEVLPENRKMFFTKGTNAHSGKGSAMDVLVANHFKSPCEYVLNIYVEGIAINVAHHTARKIENEVLEQHNAGSFPDYVFRGHYHVPRYTKRIYTRGNEIKSTVGVVTPAWQGLTEFGHRVTRNFNSIVGGIILDVQDGVSNLYPIEKTMFSVVQDKVFIA